MQFPGVSAGYILNLLAGLRGIRNSYSIKELAERFNLKLSERFQDLSHGNKQKVGLIQAFMHHPKLLILDEPTLGLDPLMQRELRALIRESQERGSTVILSSHVLSEVESVCSRIALIDRGKIQRLGTLNELRAARVHKVRALMKGDRPSAEALRALGVEHIEFDGDALQVEVHGVIDPVMKLLARFEVVELDSRELSLEEVFFSEIEK